MSQTLTTFDMATLLDSDEAISEYLSQVLADGDNDAIEGDLIHHGFSSPVYSAVVS